MLTLLAFQLAFPAGYAIAKGLHAQVRVRLGLGSGSGSGFG